MDKKAIVLISFGTTHNDTRDKTIEMVSRDLKEIFPNWDHFQAFTSGMVRKILKKRGEDVLGPEEILAYLATNGYKKVILVPTLLLDGEEYEKIVRAVENAPLEVLLLSPLLYDKSDLIFFSDFLEKTYARQYPGTILLMGHGSKYQADEMYRKLNEMLERRETDNLYIACVEGKPDFESGLKFIKKSSSSKVTLAPLMIVAGEHAKVDLNGKDSWREKLEALGYEVEVVLKGLAEYPEFRKRIVERVKDA